MKKRIACLLLTLVMLVSLIPTAAIMASADSLISEAGIRVIKDYMGFKKDAYQVGSEFRIGYGTPSTQGATITEANADQMLRQKLAEISVAIQPFVPATLVQKRFDALVWYSYVYGTGWTGSSRFVNAVTNNVTGSEFADIMCSWDYDVSSIGFPDNPVQRGILINRMAMANLYLNGVYSSANSGSLGFTVYYAGEGAQFPTGAGSMVQVFDCNQAVKVNVPAPTAGSGQFLGWYLGSTLVTGVGSATAGQYVVAGWQGSTTDKLSVNYSLPAYVIYEASHTDKNSFVIVRQEPNAASQQIDVVKRDATVTVAAEKMVGSAKWLQLSTGGWVKLCDNLEDVPTVVSSKTVTITDDYVNIRENPRVDAKKVGVARRGETRVIVMTVDSDKWGYCSEGWIFLEYTDYSNKSTGMVSGSGTTNQPGPATPGTVSGATRVNVRSGAGVGNALKTTLAEGTAVNVYEQTTVDGAQWGRIDQGWIALQYVTMKQQPASQGGSNAAAGTTVYVSSSANLNVRSGPGTNYTKTGYLAPGSAVVVLQKQVVNGTTWALIDQGWINMNYVSTSASGIGSSNGSAAVGIGGTVVNCSTGVNIRSAAGTTNALVGVAALNSRVTVSERTEVNGHYWGHIERGWVCMDYIQLDSAWTDPKPVTNNAVADLNNIVTSYEGYPVRTKAPTSVYASASSDAKILMTLKDNVEVNVLDRTNVGTKQFGKVTVGATTGWIEIYQDQGAARTYKVVLVPLQAKVTADKADSYEMPSTRSKFYTSYTKGTYLIIGNNVESDNYGWQIADGVLWGKTQDGVWVKLSDVTKFKGNETPVGTTNLNGVGYLLGTVNAESIVYEDFNGSVVNSAHPTPVATKYTLTSGHRVNILARNLQRISAGVYKIWAKVTVGSVTGWIEMDSVTLDKVEMQVTADIKAYPSLSDILPSTNAKTIAAGSKITILSRTLIADGNEVNYGSVDCGYVYVGDNAAENYWVILDEGKLANVSAAPSVGANPSVVSGVIVTVEVPAAGINIFEEAIDTSRILLKQQGGTSISILNWRLVGNQTWGKVQVGNIVGWIKVDASINFKNLNGTVNVDDLPLYNRADKDSAVQILRVKNVAVSFIPSDNPEIVFDGTTLWGKVQIGERYGYVNMANLRLNSATTVIEAPETVIATATINSVNATINVVDKDGLTSEVQSLPKGTSVNLTKVKMDSGYAWWKVALGQTDGWVNMDCLNMGKVIATIDVASLVIYDDLTLTNTLYTLYRGESVTVLSFRVTPSGALYGEVAYGDTTGWIEICGVASDMFVAMRPGSTGTTLGGNTNTNTNTNTAPTTPTTPVVTAVPGYIVCSTTVNVRSGAGVENNLVTTLKNGTAIQIYEQTNVLGKGWARIGNNQWVCMDYVKLGTLGGNTTGSTNTGNNSSNGNVSIMTTVPAGAIAVGYTNEDVKIRAGSGLGYPEVSTVKKGNSLVIYEKKLDGGMSWGRTDNGWVCISYMTMTGIGATGSGNTGTIARCGFTANVRSNANSGSALMAKVMISSRVVVHETMPIGNEIWGRTDLGWISMEYVVMDNEAAPVPVPTNPAETPNTDSIVSVDQNVG